jgi:serine/threonine-protein kinase
MDEEYWQKLQVIFDGALELDPEQQGAYLAQACDGDQALIDDVMSLLDAHVNASINLSESSPSTSPLTGFNVPFTNGDQIGHHKIIEQIGAGGMGVVYQAFDSRLQRNVALKFLPAYMHADQSSRQRFMAEARAASRLDHPNICVIHDINETPDGHMYITMPHYEGETLAARLKRGSLKLDDALSVTVQVADGLAAAHAEDIVHRDIKPANIMLTHNDTVKILDFGIAKVADVNLTRTGMGVGTLAYMAPEQMHGQDVDARADIWALGVTLYEMLTGQTAFNGEGTSQVVEAVLDINQVPTDTLTNRVPQALHSILTRAMQRNPEARYPDIKAMLEDCIAVRTAMVTGSGTRVGSPIAKNSKTAFEWEPAFLDSIIDILKPVLGPITSKLVHRQAKRCRTVEELCTALCDLLPDDEARQIFTEKMKLKAAMNTTPAPNPIKVSNPSAQLELSPVQLAKLESCLLPYVGPIAGTLIRRAIATTGEWEMVCQILADSLTNPKDQAALLEKIKGVMSE